MAIRNIVKDGDPILKKRCRPVEKFDNKLATLLDDMAETMHKANGVGLAAPQVGMLKRPEYVKVKAQDRNGDEFTLDGRELLAKAFCHEIDHLNGVVFKDVAERILTPKEVEEMENS